MRYLLDTNAWIGHFRQTRPEITQRLNLLPANEVLLCSVVLAELLFGVERCPTIHQNANRTLVDSLRQKYVSIPFDDSAAEQYARLRADLTVRGMMIGANDLLIAAIAISSGSTLVTHNTTEFGRVPGLLFEDWETP